MIAIERDWIDDPSFVAPATDQVSVWAIPLEGPWPRPDLELLLSADERQRAAAFHFERDRRRFVLARATLRRLLGRATATAPEAVRFSYGLRGKPRLAEERADPIRFNVSHSHDLALCALARGREIGVDVELVRPDVDIARIPRRFFTPDEQAALASVVEADRRTAFFRCWTRKESYLKAIGLGLFRCSTTFDVTVAPGEAPALRRVHDDPAEAARWSMRDLSPATGFVGALLVEGHGWSLERLEAVP